MNTATVLLFKRTQTFVAPVAPNNDLTYSFSLGSVTGGLNGWEQSVPIGAGAYRWVTSAVVTSDTDSVLIPISAWRAVALLSEDGTSRYTAKIYKQSPLDPGSPPAALSSYDFDTGLLTPPSGWSVIQPNTTTINTWSCEYTFVGLESETVVGSGYWGQTKIEGVAGIDGQNVHIVTIYLQTIADVVSPSQGSYKFEGDIFVAPVGWSRAMPSVNEIPTYMSTCRFSSNDPLQVIPASQWSYPVIVAQKGDAYINRFKSTCFLYAATQPAIPSGGSYDDPTAIGWSDGIPDFVTGQFLWMSSRTFYANGATPQLWSTPALVMSATSSSSKLQFSIDNVNWHDVPETNDRYMRSGVNDGNGWIFSGSTIIKGEDGTPGDAGVDGATLHTWMAYADDIGGVNGFTTGSPAPTSKCIGIAINRTTANESTNPYDYIWSQWVGTDGQPGPPGTSTFSWFAYADSPTGATLPSGAVDPAYLTNFTTGAWVNQKYMGVAFNKLTPVESQDPYQYNWGKFVGNDAPIPDTPAIAVFTADSIVMTCPINADGIPVATATCSWASVPEATSYQIRYKTDGDYTYLTVAATPTTSGAVIIGLLTDTDYYWSLRTFTGTVASDWTTEFLKKTAKDLAAPDVPTGLTLVQGLLTMVAQWTPLTGVANQDLRTYKLMVATNSDFINAETHTVSASLASFRVTIGNTYWAKVCSVDASRNESLYSPFVSLIANKTNGNDLIVADTITASSLSAVSATLGAVQAGSLTMNDAASFIRANKASYADTTAGFWLGNDGTGYRAHFGNATSHLKYDSVTGEVAIAGKLTMAAGSSLKWAMVEPDADRPADGATRNMNRGTWTGATLYQFGDVVQYTGSSYTCNINHTSGTVFNSDIAKWDLFAAAGTGVKLLGTKATVGDLPASGNTIGDLWIVTAANGNGYAWDGSVWNDVGAIRGPAGTNGAAVDIVFKRASSKPTASGTVSPPGGWSTNVNTAPGTATDPLWSAVGTKASDSTIWTWQEAIRMEGNSHAELVIYLRAGSQPATPAGGTYTFGSPPVFVAPSGGWTQAIPTGLGDCYTSRATVSTIAGNAGAVGITEWTAPVKSYTEVKVGGRNLARNGNFKTGSPALASYFNIYNNAPVTEPTTSSRFDTGGFTGGYQQVSWTGGHIAEKGIWFPATIPYKPNTTYTLSFYAKTTDLPGGVSLRLLWNTSPASVITLANPYLTTSWQQYKFSIIWGASVDTSAFISVQSGTGAGNVEFSTLQLEEGNVATDWTPAPEDVDAALSAVATAAATATDKKAQIYYQNEIPTLSTSINDDGDIWIDTDNGRKMYVYKYIGTNNAANWTSAALPDNLAALSGNESIQNSVITIDNAGKITGIGTGTNTVVDNSLIKVGGRNLLKNSKPASPIVSAAYMMMYGYQSKAIPAGTIVTLSIKGLLGADRDSFIPHVNDGYLLLANMPPSSRNASGVYTATFAWPSGQTNDFISFYHAAFSDTSASTIEWVKLEEGNVATDWTPAPEDVDAGIATAATTANWSGIADNDGNKPANNADVTDYLDNRVANNQDTLVRSPIGGTYISTAVIENRSLKITLPVSWTSTMLKFTVDIYEFAAGRACTLVVGGYNHVDGNWYNCQAVVVGGNVEYPVRFGHDGSKCCIYIGNLSEFWHHPQIAIRDVLLGYSNYTAAMWSTGWSIGFTDTLLNVTQTITDTYPGANWSKIPGGNGTGKPQDNADVTDYTDPRVSNRVMYTQAQIDAFAAAGTEEDVYTLHKTFINALNVTADSVKANWAYLGSVEANKITTANAKITAAQIGSISADTVNTSGFTAQTANIGTAQVKTLQIEDNAVVVPWASEMAQVNFTNVYSVSGTVIASVTIDSYLAGKPLLISGGADLQFTSYAGVYAVQVQIRIYNSSAQDIGGTGKTLLLLSSTSSFYRFAAGAINTVISGGLSTGTYSFKIVVSITNSAGDYVNCSGYLNGNATVIGAKR